MNFPVSVFFNPTGEISQRPEVGSKAQSCVLPQSNFQSLCAQIRTRFDPIQPFERFHRITSKQEKTMQLMKSIFLKATYKKMIFIFILPFAALFAFADRYSHLELFAQTLNLIKVNYFQPIKIETLVYGAIKGLLREVDPHSHFLLPEDLKKLKEETKGQFYGLGIEVEKKEDFLIVISIIQNSPAQKAGFQQGDKILKIDDKIVKNFNANEFRYFFKENQKRKYKITVLRNGQKNPFVFKSGLSI